MTEWKQATMAAFLPSSFESLVNSAQTTAESTATVLGTVKDLIDAAKSFLISIPPYDFASALIATLEEFKTDFLATGIYSCNMWDYPIKQYYRSQLKGEPFSAFINDLANSFNDSSDYNVPPFSDISGMLVIVGGAPGLGAISDLVINIQKAFSWWDELKSVSDKLREIKSSETISTVEAKIDSGEIKAGGTPSQRSAYMYLLRKAKSKLPKISIDEIEAEVAKLEVADSMSQINDFLSFTSQNTRSSTYPDWQRISLSTIVPPIVDVVNSVFDPLIDSLRPGRDMLATIKSLIASLESKIDSLLNIVNSINEYLDQLDDLLSATGLYAIYLDTDKGVDDLADQLKTASNPPFAELDNGFYSGIALVAGGPGITAFENLFKPIAS